MNNLHIALESIAPYYETEYKFHSHRKWRFDFAYPEKMIAFEYEGVFFGNRKGGVSVHTTAIGFSKNCEKYNHATALGWKVYRFTVKMLENGETIDFIRKVLD